ncbi:MAG: glycosyltransferase family 2 protein [Prevotella sp.]|nr:glycosyltransferase family 2 protein [Prevotella sp.]
MDLSVIIPIYNAAALLDRCLDSLFNQSTKYSYEVIYFCCGRQSLRKSARCR